MKRRERTRRLIELGGLIVKARFDALVEDDRAAIYGALLGLVQQADGEQRDEVIALWRRRGKRAFATEAMERDSQWRFCRPRRTLRNGSFKERRSDSGRSGGGWRVSVSARKIDLRSKPAVIPKTATR
ncbi:conjugal transfer protein TraD [uncultured Sphingosinicella sp.]|uniref:conjugal transfer protein TraD n=1 Tax=uncultured Sphingosinicella sp. TaxID=478748 RepID=UPI0030D6E00F